MAQSDTDHARAVRIPSLKLGSLDDLWFQVAGTLCNLACTHCFISCSPHNDSFGFLTLADVERWLAESVRWGVKEYYFTGGEPFLNRDLVPMLERTLDYGPATVLTNATVLKPEWLDRLKRAEQGSAYSLEVRVSLDGPSPETNDPIRGDGVFDRAMHGIEMLDEHGFLPILTMTRIWDEAADARVFEEFRRVLAHHGCTRPRLKILPRLQIGAEASRTSGYGPHDFVAVDMLRDYDTSQLICQHSRVVTNRGVWVCPILLDTPDARLGDSLDSANTAYPLRHSACYTCYQYGAICTNPSAKRI